MRIVDVEMTLFRRPYGHCKRVRDSRKTFALHPGDFGTLKKAPSPGSLLTPQLIMRDEISRLIAGLGVDERHKMPV